MHIHNLMLSCALSNVCCIYKKEKDVNRSIGNKEFFKGYSRVKTIRNYKFFNSNPQICWGKKKKNLNPSVSLNTKF